MILFNGKEINFISIGNKALSAIYQGTRLVWIAVRSCFGSGIWIETKPWLNEEKWKNNK